MKIYIRKYQIVCGLVSKFFTLNLELLVSIGLLSIFLIPLLLIPLLLDATGGLDWDHLTQRYWAIYYSVTEFNQYPGMNIWIAGGQPILQSPFGLFGLASILLTPFYGVSLAIYIYYIIGNIGSYHLIKHLGFEKFISACISLFFIFGNALAWHMYAGHYIFIGIILSPLLILITIKMRERYAYGIMLGILFGLMFNDNVLYTLQYQLVMMIIVSLYNIFHLKDCKYLCASALGLIVFVMITFHQYELYYVLKNEFPRIASSTSFKFSYINPLYYAVVPQIGYKYNLIAGDVCNNTGEVANYVGVLTVVLMLYLFARTNKIIYIAPFFLLYLVNPNNDLFPYFSKFLRLLPGFDSHLCTSRLRLITPYLFGGVILYGIKSNDIHENIMRFRSINIRVILFMLVFELFIFSSIPMWKSLRNISYNQKELTHNYDSYKSIFNLPDIIDNVAIDSLVSATRRNVNVVNAEDSYYSDIHLMKSLDAGNFYSNGIKIQPDFWSPNRIEFNLKPYQCMKTSLNASGYWLINGERVFNDSKIISFTEFLNGCANHNGQLIFEWQRPSVLNRW